MPPRLPAFIQPALSVREQANFTAVRSQWQNPNDILSILTIIGGDIVQRAVAQQVGGPGSSFFTPVAFSFGWVAYAFSTILSAVGDGRLMPAPDCSAVIVNARSGYMRTVQSWALSRLVRDHRLPAFEHDHRGLTIALYRTSRARTTGVPERDWVYWSSVLTILAQIGIATVPGGLYGNWMVLVITVGGTLLALAASALPRWREEKWIGRRLAKGQREVVCLTAGNGSKNVIVVISDGHGLKLEDLAAARDVPRDAVTIAAAFVLVALWLVHLVTVESLQNDAWFSLAVGALGMLQNVLAAGATRSKAALGFHLEEERIVHNEKVFKALVEVEGLEPHVGLCLLPVFFPGGLREDEEEWRHKMLAQYAGEKTAATHSPTPRDHHHQLLSKNVPSVQGAQPKGEDAARYAAKLAGFTDNIEDGAKTEGCFQKTPEARKADSFAFESDLVPSLLYDVDPAAASVPLPDIPPVDASRGDSEGLSEIEGAWRRSRLAHYAEQTLVEAMPASTGVAVQLERRVVLEEEVHKRPG